MRCRAFACEEQFEPTYALEVKDENCPKHVPGISRDSTIIPTPSLSFQVYRMFFRMRRQHAFELKTSLERAIKREDPHSSSNGRSSRRGSNGEGLAEKEDGDECGAADGPRDKQAFSKSPSEYEMEGVRRREKLFDTQGLV